MAPVVQCGWITREHINRDIENAGFSGEIDYLGVDIDGMDWWIWDAIEVVEPRIVCMEFNSLFGETEAVTIPYRQSFSRNERDVQKKRLNPKGFYGASLAALERLGRRKSYRLIATAPRSSNAYFVRNDLAPDMPAISVRDAYRKPYKETLGGITPGIPGNGLWEAAKLHNGNWWRSFRMAGRHRAFNLARKLRDDALFGAHLPNVAIVHRRQAIAGPPG